MKICDVTQFYSPVSGGVKRYVHEKSEYIEKHSPDDSHVLIVPGPKTEVTTNGRSTTYSIRSPLISRRSRYRALLNLNAVAEVMQRERPDIIESSDPYQIAWKALDTGRKLGLPVVAFYHSHFPEAYLRTSAKYFGERITRAVMDFSARYVCDLYNRFAATFVPSEKLAEVLRKWGVENVHVVQLGVNTEIFNRQRDGAAGMRASLGVASDQTFLLYVGRLAKEKNTKTLFDAFELLHRHRPHDFHLLVIGDGPDRDRLLKTQRRSDGALSWIRYCTDSAELARYYRAADLFVHPGVQETFGLVALEAQACGTPVVGIRGSYMDRIIFHEQESWARENSPQALAEAIEAQSEKKLSILGKAASVSAHAGHSWTQVFAQLFCIYRDLCANYRRP
ncbi:MAG: alpha,6-mannosyltransferase [Verrucomicrobiota bacterium]